MEIFSQLPKKVRIILIVVVLVALGALVSTFFLWSELRGAHSAQQGGEEELSALIEEIGKTIVLPDETPTLATVSDPEKLRDQAFFARSQEGDKVLIYTQSRKAILWRPSIKKIIEISPLSVDPEVPAEN
jgi:hypothetical protein